jgi:hypothetical protein
MPNITNKTATHTNKTFQEILTVFNSQIFISKTSCKISTAVTLNQQTTKRYYDAESATPDCAYLKI